MNNFFWLGLILIAINFSALSDDQISTNCADKNYRQFDFWLGSWQVTNPTNAQVSKSNISLINQGCGILEEYSTPSGYVGKSLNIYDATRDLWHQTWVDNTGLLLQLEGKFNGTSMVLTGTTLNQQKKPVLNRITWTANNNGTVNQHWQLSNDNGTTWTTAFNGTYIKIKNK